MASTPAPRASKCPVMRLFFLLSSLVATARGAALCSVPSVFHRRHVATPRTFSTLQPQRRLQKHQKRQQQRPVAASTWACGTLGDTHLCRISGRSRRVQHPPAMMCAEEADHDSSSSDGPVLILGAGWVGSRVAESLLQDDVDIVVTHRPGTLENEKPLYFRPVELPIPPVKRVDFDLADPETWKQLPPAEELSAVIITFPMDEPAEFWDAYLSSVGNVLCYSSTSVYQVDTPGQEVDEDTPLRPSPRALGESFLMDRGATVLTISGIFGEARTPRAICTCLSTYTSAGGALNGAKRVNMVHVDDIVAATVACMQTPQPSRRINVAGHHFRLEELISHCKHPEVPCGPDTDLSSKLVKSDVLLREVMPEGFDFMPPMAR